MYEEKEPESWEAKRVEQLWRICFRMQLAALILAFAPILAMYVLVVDMSSFAVMIRQTGGVSLLSVVLAASQVSLAVALLCMMVWVYFVSKLIAAKQELRESSKKQKLSP
ncbi:hypothetical protein [Lacunimicrobium album]